MVKKKPKYPPPPKLIEFLRKQPLGYKARLAEALKRPPSYLSRQLDGDRPFTERDAIGIERFTEGLVRCEDITPKFDWAYIRGTAAVRRPARRPLTAASAATR